MAQRLSDTSEQDRRNFTAEDRRAALREAVQEMTRLKSERGEIQAKMTKIRGRVKSLGIKAAEFNVALRLTELEPEDREASLAALAECFTALDLSLKGAQADLLEDVGDTASAEEWDAAAPDNKNGDSDAPDAGSDKPKRRRGRPRKNGVEEAAAS